MEYIPRLFCFREGPPLQKVLEKTLRITGMQPSLLLLDGQGIAHPRRLGMATWLGLQMGLPSMGIAKTTLLPYDAEPAEGRGRLSSDDARE
jgi:deoxyribonuclease V